MLIALPVLIPMLGAALCLLFWGRSRPQAILALASTASMLAASVWILSDVRDGTILTLNFGGWQAPFGITFVADLFGAIMVTLGAIVGVAVMAFSVGASDRLRASSGHYPLSLTLLAAVSGAFLTGDLFNLYVWFELMLLSSFVLLTLGGERGQLEGAIKYVTLNLLSSMLFLMAIGLIYGTVGTLNMADLARRIDELQDPKLATLLATLLLVSFGIKAGAFPFFFWLPASYHTPPPAVSALFSGLLTKVGVYAIIRVVSLIFDQEWSLLGDVVLVVAGMTMVTGVLGAIVQNDMRRILSFHIVSQIGYMLMGLGIAIGLVGSLGASSPVAVLAMSGAVFYIFHHIIVKANLFLISGAVLITTGSTNLKEVNGLAKSHPFLSILFLISSMSLAGIPILSGFWAKFVLVRGGLEAGSYTIVIVALAVSLLTLYSMTKIWTQVFWGEPDDLKSPPLDRRTKAWVYSPIAGMCVLTICIGIGAEASASLALDAAEQLLDSSKYIAAVFDGASAQIGDAP